VLVGLRLQDFLVLLALLVRVVPLKMEAALSTLFKQTVAGVVAVQTSPVGQVGLEAEAVVAVLPPALVAQ